MIAVTLSLKLCPALWEKWGAPAVGISVVEKGEGVGKGLTSSETLLCGKHFLFLYLWLKSIQRNTYDYPHF